MKIKRYLYTVVVGVFAMAFVSCESQADESTSAPWGEIVEGARWAANAHNVQSWQLRVVSDSELIGGLDPDRLLPETDPIGRQLVISLGALSAAAEVVAAELGFELTTEWIGDDWSLAADPGADLFRWIIDSAPSRTIATIDGLTSPTVKYRMNAASFDEATASRLASEYSSDWSAIIVEMETERVGQSIDLAILSFETEMNHEPTALESLVVTQVGPRARRENPYGITLKGNFRSRSFWFIDRMAGLFPQTLEQYTESGIKLFTGAVRDGNTLIAQVTERNDPQSWFEAGRDLQYLWMDVRNMGYELLPLSQGLQEYPEVAASYARFHELWAPEGGTVQMLLHVGEPRGRFGQSPRLPVEEILEDGVDQETS